MKNYPLLLSGLALIMCGVFAPGSSGQDARAGIAWADGRLPSVWAEGEYMLWWARGNQVPALVTTSPAGTPRAAAGVLGQPGTEVLFGEDGIDANVRGGLRATLGTWLNADQSLGVEATWISGFSPLSSGDYFVQSPGLPIIARPFFDTLTMQNASELTAYTDPSNTTIAEGFVAIRSSSEMQSGAIVLRHLYRQGPRGRIDLLGGYRYFDFSERLRIDEQVIARDPGGLVAVGTTFDLSDQFSTRNRFHGGDFGFDAEFYYDVFTLDILAKVAIGGLRRQTDIYGASVTTFPPPTNTIVATEGALLAQPTNTGRQVDNQFAVLPEFGVNLKVAITRRTSFSVGYTLLVLNDVARTGQQIDTAINSAQIGGGPAVGSPRPRFADSTFWAQGITLGLAFER